MVKITQHSRQPILEDHKVNLKLKLAILWTSIMFLYIYIDYFHLYMPESLKEISTGKVFVFDISQQFVLIAFASVMIPALMIFLSIVLSPNVNRYTNIIVATIYIPYTLFNLTGLAWMHMKLGALAEVSLLCLIIYYSWKWPCIEN